MAGPANDPASQSAIERFRDIYNQPSASANDGYFKVPNKTPPPPPTFEPPKPQKISESLYRSQQRFDSGFTSSRPLNDNPAFRSPSPMPTIDRLNIPTSAISRGLSDLAPLLKGSGPAFGIGIGLTVLPGVIEQGPNYFNPNNPNGIFAPDPRVQEIQKQNQQTLRNIGNSLKDFGLPDWLNPFKNTTNKELPTAPGDRPNAESKKRFAIATKISYYCPSIGGYQYWDVFGYSVKEGQKYLVNRNGVPTLSSRGNNTNAFLRAGEDAYYITITRSDRSTYTELCEPWTLQNLGPASNPIPNPNPPENLVPETDQPFYPPHIPDWHGYDQASPPTVLDPNDFKAPVARKPLSPLFPPTLAPVPKPLDPLQQPEPPIAPGVQPKKPTDDEEARKIPPLPFNPLPSQPNPVQPPPTFEPGAQNPNQRLNDRGIFPARKADLTATVSGSPLSPDKEIGGDPVRLKPAPTITKPKTPLETEEERKREEEKKKLANPFPLPIIPPVFPRPTGPTGTLDPVTADDITKAKDPPKPPVGTKPKCQDGCMAGLESGQQSILDKLNGGGLNGVLNGAELGLLTTINNKLGSQLIGGLAGKMTRLSEWLHLDRALNLMTYANTLHNAYFLSSGLTQTLFSAISNVLSLGGIKDAENNPLDIGSILGKTVDSYAKSVLGVSTVDGIKAEWKKYSRIYAAAASVLFSLQSIGQSILGALEIVGSYVGKIGNALKVYGAIGEKAFGFMSTTPNFQNRFFTVLEKAEEVVSQIDQVASEGLSVQDTVTQFGTQKKELEDSLKQTEQSKQGKGTAEAATVAATALTNKTASQPPTIPVEAEKKPEV